MPELPEVETTLQGITPYIVQQQVQRIIIRESRLRWPISPQLKTLLKQQTVLTTKRRGKYLLLQTETGTLLIHLGMSGRLRILLTKTQPQKHDHVDIYFSNQTLLRYTDPRRFGALLFVPGHPLQHPLLDHLGPEPFSTLFNPNYLYAKANRKTLPVKQFIMDNTTVVGVGNIYATEVLFLTKIHPCTPAGQLNKRQCHRLVKTIQQVLSRAIQAGGTTLKDFVNSHGKPGYFQQHLQVYGRGGRPCPLCQTPLQETRISNRNTVYCPVCQH